VLVQAGYEIIDNMGKEVKKVFLLTEMRNCLFLLICWKGTFPLREGKCSVLKCVRHAAVL